MNGDMQNNFPKGFGRKRVESVIEHYDQQTEQETIAEADAAFENSRMTLVRVPNELVEEVEKLISRRTKKRKSA
jgi:response regulator of citrate/malate metabolism